MGASPGPLEQLVADVECDRISVGMLIGRAGARAYGAAYCLLALPNLVPVPLLPGSTSIITGVALMLVSASAGDTSVSR